MVLYHFICGIYIVIILNPYGIEFGQPLIFGQGFCRYCCPVPLNPPCIAVRIIGDFLHGSQPGKHMDSLINQSAGAKEPHKIHITAVLVKAYFLLNSLKQIKSNYVYKISHTIILNGITSFPLFNKTELLNSDNS